MAALWRLAAALSLCLLAPRQARSDAAPGTADDAPGRPACRVEISLRAGAPPQPLHLREVRLFGPDGRQLPPDQLVFRMSSEWPGFGAARCFDGEDGPDAALCHTADGDDAPSLTVSYHCGSEQGAAASRESSGGGASHGGATGGGAGRSGAGEGAAAAAAAASAGGDGGAGPVGGRSVGAVGLSRVEVLNRYSDCCGDRIGAFQLTIHGPHGLPARAPFVFRPGMAEFLVPAAGGGVSCPVGSELFGGECLAACLRGREARDGASGACAPLNTTGMCWIHLGLKRGAKPRNLHLRELQLFDRAGGLVPPSELVYMISSEWPGHGAHRCFDGDDGPQAATCHSAPKDIRPWLRVWYRCPRGTTSLGRVEIHNRFADCCAERLQQFELGFFDAAGRETQGAEGFPVGRPVHVVVPRQGCPHGQMLFQGECVIGRASWPDRRRGSGAAAAAGAPERRDMAAGDVCPAVEGQLYAAAPGTSSICMSPLAR